MDFIILLKVLSFYQFDVSLLSLEELYILQVNYFIYEKYIQFTTKKFNRFYFHHGA